MVYDCFQFFNELDILKLRMHVLNDVVDKFVISEATVTFSGEKKPLYFQENREMFREFEDKIIHKVVDDTPMDTSAFMRDSHQKCAVEDRVKYKIKSAAHQEYNNRATLSKVKKKIRNHEDILGRSTDFQIVPVDESYPVYLREHLEEYQYLMYPEKKSFFDRILGR